MKILGFNINKDKKEVAKPATDSSSQNFGSNIGNSLDRVEGISNGMISFGPNNLLPQDLNKMFHSSSLHSNIINFKKLSTIGSGFVCDTTNLKGMDLVSFNQMVNFFDGDVSLDDTIDLITMDYFLHADINFIVTWNDDFTKVIRRRRVPPETIRIKDVDKYGIPLSYNYCMDWLRPGKFGISCISAFSITNKTDHEQLLRYQGPKNGLLYYSLPLYTSAFNWIQLDAEIPNFHRSNIQNSINFSVIVKNYSGVPDEEFKQKYLRRFDDAFSGTDNAGRALHMFYDNKDQALDIEGMPQNDNHEKFINLQDSVQRNIVYAHGIDPIILGFKVDSSLGNGTELVKAYEIFTHTVISPARRDIENIINKLFKLNGLYVNFKIVNKDLFTVGNSNGQIININK